MRKNKTDQLRVRLTMDERKALDSEVARRQVETPDFTISDIIREALTPLLGGQYSSVLTVTLPPYESGILSGLSSLLKRKPSDVAAACINDILNAAEDNSNRTPTLLTAQEIRLRRRYAQPASATYIGRVDKVEESEPAPYVPHVLSPEGSRLVMLALNKKNKILAIKEYRADMGCNLYDAKDAVNAIIKTMGLVMD